MYPLALALDGYHPIFYSQQDPSGRNRNAGGGVALWCDSDLACTRIPDLRIFEPHVFESVFVKIEVTPRKFIVIGNIYRPPNAENHISEFNTKLAFILDKIHEQYSGTSSNPYSVLILTPKVQDYTTHVPANYSPLPIFSDSVCGLFTTHRVCYGGVA